MIEKNYKQYQILDFDPDICGVEDGYIVLFSPWKLIIDGVLIVPDGIRMPDGTIIDDIRYDAASFLWNEFSFLKTPITMYAGHTYLKSYLDYGKDRIADYSFKYKKVFNNLANICLFEDEIDGYTSKNGILYDKDGKIACVPPRNLYAQTMPLEYYDGKYHDDGEYVDYEFDDCLIDAFGGVYSQDGKTFVRYIGEDTITYYKVRDGVKRIEDLAFWQLTAYGLGNCGLTNLYEVDLPDSLEYIGAEAFKGSGLKKIIIPDSVTTIGKGAFLECKQLEEVVLPKRLVSIGESAFECTALISPFIPRSVESIGYRCFDNCWQLCSITVENENRFYSSENGALYNADKTTLIRIPLVGAPLEPDVHGFREPRHKIKSETPSEYKVKEDCHITFKNLFEGITFKYETDDISGKTYKEIIHREGDNVRPRLLENGEDRVHMFYAGQKILVENEQDVKAGTAIYTKTEYEYEYSDWLCWGKPIDEFIVPETVTEIVGRAFQRTSLGNLTIPNGVRLIGKEAFVTSNLKSISIGTGVQEIGEDPFLWCPMMESINVDKNNEYFCSIDGVLYNKGKTRLIACPQNVKAPKLPRGLVIITERAFMHCKADKLIIPEGVTSIGDEAFRYCRIKEIYFPRSLEKFGDDVAFDAYFEKMYVPKGLANKLKKDLCISMQDYDYELEEYIDLPFELDEAVKKNLQRFIHAQNSGGIFNGTDTYAEALQEVKNGRKSGHWIWYVFPQMKGLCKSEISQFYGINGREEARAYIEHPILRERLVEICEAILKSEKSVYEIFGADTIKVRACILLFASVSDIPVFKQIKSKYRW